MIHRLTSLAGFAAPLILILSPVLSYTDQAYSMHREKSSKGFSLDIPLIMLVASLLRIFYYPGARFDTALLIQSFIMVGIQLVLLKVALDHRPPASAKGGDMATPFADARDNNIFTMPRPYNFWQWRSSRPYYQFLLYLFIALTVLELLLPPLPNLYMTYSSLIGYVGLSVEAALPLPQIFANRRSRSCKGFRLSVLASWLVGDVMKMFWFFTATSEIPWSFKLCGIFQAGCDAFLGLQYWMYGDRGQSPPSMGAAPVPGVLGGIPMSTKNVDGRVAGGGGGGCPTSMPRKVARTNSWGVAAPGLAVGDFSPRRNITPASVGKAY